MTATKYRTKFPLVYIEWEDAEHEGGWSEVGDEPHHKLGTILSIGWLIHENKQRVVICSSLATTTTQVGNKQYIPVNQITRIKKTRQAG